MEVHRLDQWHLGDHQAAPWEACNWLQMVHEGQAQCRWLPGPSNKVTLVAKGYSQRPGFDFKETFAPTVCYSTICIVLALAALEDLELCSVDISHAYLNGTLEEEIYVMQPEGFEVGGPDHVCKLVKSLYGLKQAGRVWNKLHSALSSMGFEELCPVGPWALYLSQR